MSRQVSDYIIWGDDRRAERIEEGYQDNWGDISDMKGHEVLAFLRKEYRNGAVNYSIITTGGEIVIHMRDGDIFL